MTKVFIRPIQVVGLPGSKKFGAAFLLVLDFSIMQPAQGTVREEEKPHDARERERQEQERKLKERHELDERHELESPGAIEGFERRSRD